LDGGNTVDYWKDRFLCVENQKVIKGNVWMSYWCGSKGIKKEWTVYAIHSSYDIIGNVLGIITKY
jgi:hypothetical protein